MGVNTHTHACGHTHTHTRTHARMHVGILGCANTTFIFTAIADSCGDERKTNGTCACVRGAYGYRSASVRVWLCKLSHAQLRGGEHGNNPQVGAQVSIEA
eukprot:GHVU01136758.1.p1 GENE.GHVU01136758.1~~GHVU01136758.1.p1  ORF type:complete len:100 (+),score=2.51 GHVU01136758.1:265-564(+)